MMNNDDSYLAREGAIQAARDAFNHVADCMIEPCVLYRPALSVDGNQWCALYGENLQDGVAGFGDSPADAMAAFNKAWHAKLNAAKEPK
jgi:hypothetical protein